MAPWTAEILDIKKNADGLTVSVTYRVTNGSASQTTTEPLVPISGGEDPKLIIWRLAQDKANYLNRVDAQKDAVLNLDPSPILGVVDLKPVIKPPTQDELDLAAFQKLIADYRQAVAELKGGIGKTTQADVDALIGQIKTTYKDEYAPLIVGLF